MTNRPSKATPFGKDGDRLRGRLDEPTPTPIDFREVEEAMGRFVRYGSGASDYGSFRTIILEDANGELRSVALFHQALQSQVKQARPKPGELIGIKKGPEVVSANGRKYRSWKVVLDREETSLDPEGDEIDEGLQYTEPD
jgi:hypothetical protein